MLTPQEREEFAAVRDSDGRGLPIQAIIASQRYLAAKCLELDNEVRQIVAPPPEPMPTLDQLLPDRHKPKMPPPEERRRSEAPMDKPRDAGQDSPKD